MHDFDQFERRFAVAVRADADRSVAPFDPASIARAAMQIDDTGRGRRTPQLLRDSRIRRRTWLLVAATFLVGAGVIGASLVGGRLLAPTPGPTAPNTVVDASASPETSPEASVAPLPAPGMFAYVKATDGPGGRLWGRLWVANLDGTGAHELVPDMGGDQQAPVWSPDGTHLLFSRAPATIGEDGYPIGAFRFYLADVSGGEPQLLDTGCVAPCTGDGDLRYYGDAGFSRDGTRLVFVRSPSPGASVLATIDLSTGRVVELTSTMLESDLNRPRFSPDGSQIVFIRELPIDPSEPKINGDQWPGPVLGLFTIDADGRNLRQIVPSGMPMDWPSYASADWSPNGAHLVLAVGFASNPVPYAVKGNGYTITPTVDIYTIRPDGTDLRRLTSDGGSLDPGWTPDGRILFSRWAPDQPLPLWIMDADGSNATQLSFPQQLLGASPNQAAITALTTP